MLLAFLVVLCMVGGFDLLVWVGDGLRVVLMNCWAVGLVVVGLIVVGWY